MGVQNYEFNGIKKKSIFSASNITAVVTTVLATVLAINQAIIYFYKDNKPTIDAIVKEVVKKEEVKTVPTLKAEVMGGFNVSDKGSDIILPDKDVDVYKLVKIRTDAVATYYDLMVMTVNNGNILFLDTVKTANQNEWVFTGPPGKYSIRMTLFDPNTGFNSMTGSVTIGGTPVPPTPPSPPTPPNPPTPPQPPTPPPPALNGKYGFDKMTYQTLSKIPTDVISYKDELAKNFEAVAGGIAAGAWKTPDEANKELAGRNRLTFNNDTTLINKWMPFFQDWQNKASTMNKDGSLPNIVAEYRLVYLETAAGLKAFK